MNPDLVVVRSAVHRDVPRLAELRWEFRSTYGSAAEERATFVARCSRWMNDALASGGTWRAWLAEADGHVVGSIWLQVIEKIPNPVDESELHAYISSLYVTPEARERGIGRRLLDIALAHCRMIHPQAVILWPTPRSRALYERAGFGPADDIMALNLHGPPNH